MKLELFDVDEFVELNGLQEVTSPILFERGGIPNPEGLISNEIFGVSVKQRRETFAYIDLHKNFIHPHIYKAIRRVFRNIDKIISGEMCYKIDKDGTLVKDEKGETGIDFIYNNWNKIKWPGDGERTKLITKTKKNQAFMSKCIVIPAFYRDIQSNDGGGGSTSEINNMYVKLIRMSSMINSSDMFDFSFYSAIYNIENTLIEVYDYFRDKLDKKNGMLRKYLLGKNVDYCVRSVISAPIYNNDDPKDNIVDFTHAALSVSRICVLCYPFMISWLRNFFERNLMETKTVKLFLSDEDKDRHIELVNPESYYNETYIKKVVEKYVKDPSSRFDTIEVPTNDDKQHYLSIIGRYRNVPGEQAGIMNRYATWTDLLYIACCDIVKNKHAMITRYPILNNYGFFFTNIRVSSTHKTQPMEIDGVVYKWYPVIDLNMKKEQIANAFVDVSQFSNAYLLGLDGDYDGDQTTVKILWTNEANAEAEKIMSDKANIIGPDGSSIRVCDLEAIQTFFVLTKTEDE